jgi:hypothetical protein
VVVGVGNVMTEDFLAKAQTQSVESLDRLWAEPNLTKLERGWRSDAAGRRVDDAHDFVDGVGREADSRRLLLDAVFAGGDVDAESLSPVGA